jgi:hypothetical protein
MTPAHSAYPDDPFGELVAGGEIAAAQDMSGHNEKADTGGSCVFQETAPALVLR